MPVTYFVALPFIRTEEGVAPGEPKECQSEGAAIRLAEVLSRKPEHAGALAFKRSGDPTIARFSRRRSHQAIWRSPGHARQL